MDNFPGGSIKFPTKWYAVGLCSIYPPLFSSQLTHHGEGGIVVIITNADTQHSLIHQRSNAKAWPTDLKAWLVVVTITTNAEAWLVSW